VELDEHINFHSFESNGDVNSLITPLGALRKEKGGKQTLEHLVVDEFPKKQEEEASRVEKLSKEFLVLMDAFCVFVFNKEKPQHKTKSPPS
jgi:hypothetical protein